MYLVNVLNRRAKEATGFIKMGFITNLIKEMGEKTIERRSNRRNNKYSWC
jgi:hypothetical protein